MPIVDPNEYTPHLVVWSTFNIFATCANTVLLAVTLTYQPAPGCKPSSTYILTSTTSSLLIWTGHARDMYPPYRLCLSNALLAMANVPLMGAAALSTVLKVWGSVMIVCHPKWTPVLEWVIWMPFVRFLPYVPAVPRFQAYILAQIGLHDPSKVYRGSSFYCVLDHTPLQTAASAFGAVYTLLCLILSGWTTFNLITTRWRVRRIVDYPGVSYPFVFRTLVFSIFVSVSFVVGILSLLSTFSAIVPDVVLSSCPVAAFFIFATAKVC
ncbi:hypothetical protein C8R43DRAFT_876765 [Mycena crocata]|nr:hypothetical protein C8R43DRAFT_876765 [Mycena crocata]